MAAMTRSATTTTGMTTAMAVLPPVLRPVFEVLSLEFPELGSEAGVEVDPDEAAWDCDEPAVAPLVADGVFTDVITTVTGSVADAPSVVAVAV